MPTQALASAPARRLSHVEYERTVQALFPEVTVPKQGFAPDLVVKGFENDSAALNASPVLLEQYSTAASQIAELASAAPEKLAPCMASSPDMGCARQFIASFGRRAFRRPLSSEEQSRYEGLFAQFAKDISFAGAFELTLSAFLQAPQFLYRLELGAGDEAAGSVVALDDYAMASRLSYFLWQSMPDDALLDAAAGGLLKTPAQVAEQARRMLRTEAAQTALVDFHRQWLGFDRVLDENKDPDLFPAWNDRLREAIRRESDQLVAHVFGDDGSGSVFELLTTRVTFANAALAELYGIPLKGKDWEQPQILPATERAGLLTRANFLAGRAHTTNGSPPLRGVAVLNQLLCAPPPAPPANANAKPPVADAKGAQTNRQLFEERTAPAECQACHKKINGIGYAFEGYDSTGRFRTQDQGMPVDAHGELMGTDVDGPYSGALQLSSLLASSRQVQECATKTVLRYAFGRVDDEADACMLEALAPAMSGPQTDLREVLVQVASSYPFMNRMAIAP